MKITNKFGLPESLVKACDVERHNKPGEVSATTLLKGTKQIILTDRHWDELEDDVSNRCWALFGTAVHKLLEEANPTAFTEESFSSKVGGKTVTGRVDLYDMANKTLTDYKTASVWKVVFNDYEDWRRQGLIYAWLMREAGLEVDKCRFVAMLRDWSATEAERKPDYPKSQVVTFEFAVTEEALGEIERFIKDKVADIEAAEVLDDDAIGPCSPEERWERAATYAVMKEGRKTAVRVFESKDDADKLAAESGKGFSVVERKGKCVRCEGYCLCREHCSFWKSLQEEAEND